MQSHKTAQDGLNGGWSGRLVTVSFITAIAIRVLIPLNASKYLSTLLFSRLELTTPMSGFRNLLESIYLYQHGFPPGGLAYASPLFSSLLSPLVHFTPTGEVSWLSKLLLAILWAICDVLVALSISKFTRKSWTAHLYLWNPVSIATCAAHSMNIFVWLLTLNGISRARKGEFIASISALSLATLTGFYPVIFLPAAAVMLSRKGFSRRSVLGSFFVISLAGLELARHLLGADSLVETARGVFGPVLTVRDLDPNLGLWWYMFVEVFEDFRTLFIWMFQLQLFVHIAPLYLRFPRDPEFQCTILAGIWAAFGPYPTSLDICNFLILSLPYANDLRYGYITASTYLVTATVTPLFYDLWVVRGDGNANYFYAFNLVLGLSNCFYITDLVFSRRKTDLKEALGKDDIGDVVLAA